MIMANSLIILNHIKIILTHIVKGKSANRPASVCDHICIPLVVTAAASLNRTFTAALEGVPLY